MEHIQIIKDISLGKVSPVYLLMGEEPYFIDVVTGYMEEHLLDEGARAFCQSVVYGRDTELRPLLSLARSFPMMGERQLIIVKEAQDMKEWKKEDNYAPLMSYLEKPQPTTVLVFAHKYKNLDKRTKLYKQFQKCGVVMNAEKIRDNKLPAWIADYVKSQGLKISGPSSHLLADYLGADLGKVASEVAKLSVVLKPGEEITPQVIEDHIGISKDYNVWELTKALSHKDVMKSNRIIHYFDSNPKANPIQMVIPSLYLHFSKLVVFLHAMKNNQDPVKASGVNPYAAQDYRDAAKHYTPAKAERIIGYLHEADRRSKGMGGLQMEPGDIMKELVFKILH